ncbi:efflux RND transporter permease subunit [Neptuniibacter halophilus]|uniref:efflux RND transporter permease subunit n=1 Tax=Neptuniibacter halophilus TaxID=651666 RepID=UPI0025740657|nr:efflux RND transporter permease subunit [Neptuniibacter halophilus]
MLHSRGLANWSISHPVGVVMIALAVMVVGLFSLHRLSIDLLPHIIYPEIRVRVLDNGVPPSIMEDKITRQLEEQLAITEDAYHVQSNTTRGVSTVDLSFDYGKDIDIALRDASTRLDRAKRFLPDSIDPPVIYKLDPSQIPVMEFVVSSAELDSTRLRDWTDNTLSKWLLNLPGVAAAEVGGGVVREVHVIPDQQRLKAYGLSYTQVIDAIRSANSDDSIGRIDMSGYEIASRISGRLQTIDELKQLPIAENNGQTLFLTDVAQVESSAEDERILIRANGTSGIKLSIQKQPTANTTEVAAYVKQRLAWLQSERIIPTEIQVTAISDQSIYITQSLSNAAMAAISGALLAMAVVYMFLGNLRHTLIIGSAIPIAIMFTCVLMGLGDLTLNIMTLGGLALGIGMLVDNTIVMLENINRHQQNHEQPMQAAQTAATEVNSAIIASTSTNLCAVLPFLFIGGLTGLLFQELIITISAAIFASMIIALTLVPALAARSRILIREGRSKRRWFDRVMRNTQAAYASALGIFLNRPGFTFCAFILALGLSVPVFMSGKQIFLPQLDNGLIRVIVSADTGISLPEMNAKTRLLETLFEQQEETETLYTLVGGSVFGRTQRETPSRSTITVQLKPLQQRSVSSQAWIQRMNKQIAALELAGLKVRMSQRGIRGIRTSRGDDDISLRLQGDDLQILKTLAEQLVDRVRSVSGLRNITHSAEDSVNEISLKLDRVRAAQLGVSQEDLVKAARISLQGQIISDFIEGDRSYDIRMRFNQTDINSPQALENILLFPQASSRPAVLLGDVAAIELLESPATIMRDNQMRIVEVTASLVEGATLGEVLNALDQVKTEFALPQGYTLYDGGARQALEEQNQLTLILLGLALFLVFVVMAIQYESLRNPLIIIFGVPFCAIGVALGIELLAVPLSMPVWLGMIMLTGIVVNNAILMVEYIEIARQQRKLGLRSAILTAARLRLRPVIMTTLSTVAGMFPLALGWGDGAEMLQPLAITVVWGLSFSLLVSLLLIPVVYQLVNRHQAPK